MLHETKDTLAAYGHNWPVLGGKLLIVLFMVVLFWHIMNRTFRTVDEEGNRLSAVAELFDNNHTAYLVWRAAWVAGQVVAMLPVMKAPDGNVWVDLTWSFAEACLVSIVMQFAIVIVDKAILGKVDNALAVLDHKNMAVALADGAMFIALGFMLNGSLDGTAPTIGTGFKSMAAFGLLGFGLVVGVYWLHELITKDCLRDHIRDGDVTAAWNLAGIVIPVAIVSREGVAGDFTNWGNAFAGFGATAVIAILTLYGIRLAIDKFVITGRTMRDVQKEGQSHAAALMTVMMICLAFLAANGVRAIL